MKKVLCFGDSNTYGFIPQSGLRYDKNTRWTGILQSLCRNELEVIEAGCNNRTAFIDNPAGIEQTGYKILPKYLKTEYFDIIILAIGVNDLQLFFKPTLKEFEQGIEKLVQITKELSPKSKIILTCPAKLNLDGINNGIFNYQFDEISVEKSFKLPQIYKSLADKHNCGFVDLNKVTEVSPLDGLHFSPESHKKIAEYLYKYLTQTANDNI